MEAPPKLTEPTDVAPQRKRAVRRLIVFSLVTFVLATVAITLSVSDSSYDKLTWLTPAEMTRAAKPGPLTQLKYRLQRTLGPLTRFFHRKPKAFLRFESSILNLTNGLPPQFDLSAPISTNADGTRAWILSPTELLSFQAKVIAGLSPVASPRMLTADDVRSQITIGNTILVAGKPVLAGLMLDLMPHVSGNSIKLLIRVTDTETNTGASANSISMQTNLAVACKVSVPNGGALLIDGGKSREQHYWMILAPALVDAMGKPIKR